MGNHGASPGPRRCGDDDLTIRPLMRRGGRAVNALPNRDHIVPVRSETDFGMIVGYLFHIKPREGRRGIQNFRMDGVVIDEKHMRQLT